MNKRIKIPRKEKSKRFLQLTSQLLLLNVAKILFRRAIIEKGFFLVGSTKMHGLILNIMFRLAITYIVVSCISKIVRQFSKMFFKLLSDIMRKFQFPTLKVF